MNYATNPWYEERRTKIMEILTFGKPLSGKKEKRESPSKRYTLYLTPYKVKDPRCPFYCVVDVIRNSDGKSIGKIIRNEADFPFLFVEDYSDGKDYLFCAEDYQGFTLIDLHEGKKYDYIGEKSKRDLSLRITDFYLSPNRQCVAIEGHSKSKPSDLVELDEIHFYSIKEITKLPYKEIDKRITFAYDKAVGWENDSRFIVSRLQDVIVPAGIILDEVDSPEERIKHLSSGNIKKQLAYYAYYPKSGEMEQVFSEWR
jgi:hypothetical protein